MILVDTEVLIWNFRGNPKAAEILDALPGFSLSAVTYVELVQGTRDKNELKVLRQALHFWHAHIIHIDETISARATFLVEQHTLANSMQLADALIAATALEHGLDLLTANDKHYRLLDELTVRVFRPS